MYKYLELSKDIVDSKKFVLINEIKKKTDRIKEVFFNTLVIF